MLTRFIAFFTPLAIFSQLYAGNTASTTINYEVLAVQQIAVSGNPSTLVINSATAGTTTVTPAVNSSTTMAITTNVDFCFIKAQITAGTLPSGATLSVSVATPSGATSAGTVQLSTSSAQNLVTNIPYINQSGLTITYTLNATLSTPQTSGSVTVTFTLGGGGS